MVLQQPALALTLAMLARIVSTAGTAQKKVESAACANRVLVVEISVNGKLWWTLRPPDWRLHRDAI